MSFDLILWHLTDQMNALGLEACDPYLATLEYKVRYLAILNPTVICHSSSTGCPWRIG